VSGLQKVKRARFDVDRVHIVTTPTVIPIPPPPPKYIKDWGCVGTEKIGVVRLPGGMAVVGVPRGVIVEALGGISSGVGVQPEPKGGWAGVRGCLGIGGPFAYVKGVVIPEMIGTLSGPGAVSVVEVPRGVVLSPQGGHSKVRGMVLGPYGGHSQVYGAVTHEVIGSIRRPGAFSWYSTPYGEVGATRGGILHNVGVIQESLGGEA